MSAGWSVREVARRSGRSSGLVVLLARSGMLPGYVVRGSGRQGAQIPAVQASAFTQVLQEGLGTTRVAERMREDPERVLAAANALAKLARMAIATRDEDQGEAA